MTAEYETYKACWICGIDFEEGEAGWAHTYHEPTCLHRLDEREGCYCNGPSNGVVHEGCCPECGPAVPTESNRNLRARGFYAHEVNMARIPALYATEDVRAEDEVVHLSYSLGACYWQIVERDPKTNIAFGFACLGDPINAEWGYVDLSELEALTVLTNEGFVAVERDYSPKGRNVVDPYLSWY